MLQSILVIFGIMAVLVFYADVRRKAQGQSRAVQKERETIAEQTHSTAIVSSFTEGGSSEVLLGVSEDSGLFFYRRIDQGKLVLHYTLRLSNLTYIALQINGEKRDFESESVHMTGQMRATDISRQARLGLQPEEMAKIKHIRLNIFFRSEDGKEKNIPVIMYRATQRGGMEALSKCFENAVWWQQYLSQVSKRRSENDTLTFASNEE